MIGEASGVTTLINNERIQRENQVSSGRRNPIRTKNNWLEMFLM